MARNAGMEGSMMVFLVFLVVSTAGQSLWSEVDEILSSAVSDGAFPGCVALVADESGPLYIKPFGNLTYGATPPFSQGPNSPPMSVETLFDMASCTKVMSVTPSVALLYQYGYLDVNTKVADPALLGPDYAQNGKGDITVLNLLLHNAGYPPDPNPNYWFPQFGCPETTQPEPAENFSCLNQVYTGLMAQTLQNPIGQVYVYSDLSFITLAFVVGRVVSSNPEAFPVQLLPGCLMNNSVASTYTCYFEAFARTYVFSKLGMESTGFLPKPTLWGQCAPAENDTVYERKVIQGQVSDGNAYAMGGIAGHAGLFSNVLDAYRLAQAFLFPDDVGLINSTTAKFFIAEFNHTQSSRALGWNTNDPNVFDMGWNNSCGNLSSVTFMHTGYTGTQICADPVRKVITVLLTNRVYPTDTNEKILIVRPLFNTAAVFAWQSIQGTTQVIPKNYPLFKQCNSSWGNDVMEVQTICEVGCLMSSVSMAINGFGIPIDGQVSDPGVLNHWLQKNGGYVDGDDLDEAVVPKIAPNQIQWIGMMDANTTRDQIVWMLEREEVVIANVDNGHHFVLVIGYDVDPAKKDLWYVNDPGFNRTSYTQADVVGWRIFTM